MKIKITSTLGALFRARFTPLVVIVALFGAPPLLRAQTLYVSTPSGIDRVSSTGVVSVFVTLAGDPQGLAFDGSGNLYVDGYTTNQISRVTPGGMVSPFATLPSDSGNIGLAFDGGGNLYAVNIYADGISKITSAGVVSSFASVPAHPIGAAVDSSGNVYAASADNNQISKVTAAGVVSVFATVGSSSSGLTGLTIDASGNLFAGNQTTGEISKITPTGVVSLLANLGHYPISNPIGLAVDSSGTVYVADDVTNQIYKITSSGVVSVFATVNQVPYFIAVVEPTVPPTITVTDASDNAVPCGGVKTVSNNGQCGAVTVPLTIAGSGGCPGAVAVASTRSDGKLLTDPYPVGSTVVTSTATDACGNMSSCVITVEVTNDKTIAANFNGTAIPGSSYIWFNSVLKPSGLNTTPAPVTVKFINQKITSSQFSLPVPDTTVVFDSTVTCASAAFTDGHWMITAPKSGLSGNIFLSGLSYQVPAAGLPGGIKPVSWSGTFITDTAGVSLNWQWSAAVYNSFSPNNSVLGVKATDDNHHDCTYLNSDHAGTPEQYKPGLIGGATGGGGSNYTGGLSGTQSIAPCDSF